jgi:lipoate-protein ligase A
VIYCEHDSHDAAFWFAAEEFAMRDLRAEEPVLMLWSTADTVMVGANQIVDAEIDRTRAEAEGVAIVRRSSGGGTIFTDPGTLQYTVIQPHGADCDTKDVIRRHLAGPVLATIGRLGATASIAGRNDILLGGRKISGIAQYIRFGRLCSHGSLLFSADLEKLARVLTGDNEKVVSKALKSIRGRVTNVAEHVEEQNVARFRRVLEESWGSACADSVGAGPPGRFGRRAFSAADLAAIEGIRREKYANPAWTFGHEPAFAYRNAKRFPGGRVEVFLQVERGEIRQCGIRGDFLALRPVDAVCEAFRGLPRSKQALAGALGGLAAGVFRETFGTVTQEELLSVIAPESPENMRSHSF